MQSDIGVIGLAVMGQNLVLNMNDHGYVVSVFNRSGNKTEAFMVNEARDTSVRPFFALKDFISSLKRPRRILLMVKSGNPVDDFIEALLPFLEKGDIIIDGGNSHYRDSERRCESLKNKGILFVGAGISGGEEGARFGPSIMPGGNIEAWSFIESVFKDISAKVNGKPCCQWIGPGGSGHYVKMVHNGIEYGDMQLISETYSIMKRIMGFSNPQIADIFDKWNSGKLNSYLIEITANILRFKDESGKFLLDCILDVASQKGTGSWTGIAALELGVPASLISEAVFVRYLSSLKEQRLLADREFSEIDTAYDTIQELEENDLEASLYAAKIISYAQGFMLMKQASDAFSWNLHYGDIALVWRSGCIIRSIFLDNIKESFDFDENLPSLILAPFFKSALKTSVKSWRKMITVAMSLGIPIPCFSSSLSFFDGYCESSSSACMIQAMRDYFGAHTYERNDTPRGEFFHTKWT
ncbi:MAG: decarboxylating NADP(+)-dependent phosphogluconate dehydrogenase [Victivallaceae bacterium]